MHPFADQTQRPFQFTASGTKRVSVNSKRRANHDQRSTVRWRLRCLFKREPTHGLYRNRDSIDDLAQAIKRSGGGLPSFTP